VSKIFGTSLGLAPVPLSSSPSLVSKVLALPRSQPDRTATLNRSLASSNTSLRCPPSQRSLLRPLPYARLAWLWCIPLASEARIPSFSSFAWYCEPRIRTPRRIADGTAGTSVDNRQNVWNGLVYMLAWASRQHIWSLLKTLRRGRKFDQAVLTRFVARSLLRTRAESTVMSKGRTKNGRYPARSFGSWVDVT